METTKGKKVYALYFGPKGIEPERNGNAGHAELGVVEITETGAIRNPTKHGYNWRSIAPKCAPINGT